MVLRNTVKLSLNHQIGQQKLFGRHCEGADLARATIVKNKVTQWDNSYARPSPSEIKAEIKRLRNLLLSHEALAAVRRKGSQFLNTDEVNVDWYRMLIAALFTPY